jgi:membrane peptidoglycan carboxypeptidase
VNIQGYSSVYGGTIPALIWRDFMTAALEGKPVREFAEPSFDGYDTAPPTPVASPTPSPSPSPSESPTPEPSESPTPKPTKTPSLSPTPTPPPSPTTSPTPPPTPTPAVEPHGRRLAPR